MCGGHQPTADGAVELIVADARRHDLERPRPEEEPFAGYWNAKRELSVGADLPHKSALELLRPAIDTIDCLTARQHVPLTPQPSRSARQ